MRYFYQEAEIGTLAEFASEQGVSPETIREKIGKSLVAKDRAVFSRGNLLVDAWKSRGTWLVASENWSSPASAADIAARRARFVRNDD